MNTIAEKQTHRTRSGDITGMRSGMLVAIERTDQKKRSCTLWRCRCDCGKDILLEPYKIRNQIVRSCGCQRGVKRIKDLTGQRFGRLTALYRLDKMRGSSYLWQCRCDCGKEVQTTANSLLSGNSKSCGCGRVDAVKRTTQKYGTVADHVHLIDGTCVEKLGRRGLQRNNTSGYTGVQARGNKWIAMITFKKKVYYLGIYAELEEAVRARRLAEERLHGEFLDWYHTQYGNVDGQRKQKSQRRGGIS